MLSSEEQINSLNLGEHLDWVLNSIISSKEQILLLQKIEGISMRIDCVWYSKGDESGITLTPEQMRKMTALNLQCSFKLCFLMNSPKGSLVNNRVSNCLGYEGDAE
jgi:hypothetical protein